MVFDPLVVGMVGSGVLVVLLVIGMPIAYSMMFAGVMGLSLLTSPLTALDTMLSSIYHTCTDYPYTIIPLFVLMGSVASAGGITESLYRAFDRLMRGFRGGLAIATIFACGGFAAISGSSVAAAAAMGRIAYPEMKKLGYHDQLSTGSIAAGGTLSFLIPPSLGFVVYGMLTEQSIGKLLIAGILPGILLTLAYAGVVLLRIIINPNLAPRSAGEGMSLGARIRALAGVVETLIIFAIVIGGIYLGFFTPTEAGAVGAASVLVAVFIRKGFGIYWLLDSLFETVRVSTFVLFIVAGANVFSYFLAMCNIPTLLSSMIASMHIPKHAIISLILVLYLILGCFLDAISMMVLTIPVIFPLVLNLGFDPIWFGVMAVLMMEAGLLTPPIGLNVYTLSGVTNVPTNVVFRGSAPFLFAIFGVCGLLMLWPNFALYLPNLMMQ